MSDAITYKQILDEQDAMKKVAHEKECASETVKCEWCKDTGIIVRTEWSDADGKDMDYEVETRCVCQED